MFRAGSRGNVYSEKNDTIFGFDPWFLRWSLSLLENNDNLLHAVGNSWRGCTLCSYSRSSNLLLNGSLLPEASVPCFWQFKLGPCRLVYKWSIWKWRNMGFQLLQERQPYSFGRRSPSFYWFGKNILPCPSTYLIQPIHLICRHYLCLKFCHVNISMCEQVLLEQGSNCSIAERMQEYNVVAMVVLLG
jgi:hypothetical protein